jgi:drug/metabolite transporter (DMT)-like permease
VEGNYLIVRAYQYTDITSVTLLDAFAVPVVMAISSLAMSARYSRRQMAGVLVCLAGLVMLVCTDALLQPMHRCAARSAFSVAKTHNGRVQSL